MSDMRIMVAGAGGRMGRTLIKAIAETPGLALSGALEDAKSPLLGQDSGQLSGLGNDGIALTADAKDLIAKADGVIDFTVPKASVALAALTAGKVHIIGTTGHSADEEAKVKDAAKSATIVKSGNMSLGVNLLAALTKRVAKTLGEEFDVEIFEMHHSKNRRAIRHRIVARTLGGGRPRHRPREALTSRPRRRNRCARHRQHRLRVAARRQRGRRARVIFAGPAERVELIHRAEDRMIFARGALKAALWAGGRSRGSTQ